jgi:hypothetical protein
MSLEVEAGGRGTRLEVEGGRGMRLEVTKCRWGGGRLLGAV